MPAVRRVRWKLPNSLVESRYADPCTLDAFGQCITSGVTDRRSPLGPPANSADHDGLLEAFQGLCMRISEARSENAALPANRVMGEDLARLGGSANARSDLYRATKQVFVCLDRFACGQADTRMHLRHWISFIEFGGFTLNALRTSYRIRHQRK